MPPLRWYIKSSMLNPFPVYPLFIEWVWGGVENTTDFSTLKEQLKKHFSKECQVIEDDKKLSLKTFKSKVSGFSSKCKDFFLTLAFISTPIFNEIRVRVDLIHNQNAINNLTEVISLIETFHNKIYSPEFLNQIRALKLGLVFVGIPTLKNKVNIPKPADWDFGLESKYFFLKRENLLGFAINFGINPVIDSESISIKEYRFVLDSSLLRKHSNIYPPEFSFEYFIQTLNNWAKSISKEIGGGS